MARGKLDFRVVPPGGDAEDVFRFRYLVYEVELNQGDPYADHVAKTIRDPIDDTAYIVAAYRDDAIVGTARVNFCADGNSGYYLDFYELESRADEFPDGVSFSTRIMVAKSERGGTLPLLISVECFKLGLARGVKWCFCGCNMEVKPFFEKLGYEVQHPGKMHRDYGLTAVMRFNLDDPKHYDRRRSVFARYLKKPDA